MHRASPNRSPGYTRFAHSALAACALVVALAGNTLHAADDHRVLPADTTPNDPRLREQKDLNGYFPFIPPTDAAAWQRRAEQVRRQILVAAGLWPMPEATPLKPVIHTPVDRSDYAVEKVYFQSYPGHFVTGNLYRPKGRTGRLPGVLCPHGHWTNGRFTDAGPKQIRQELVQGAERFAVGGRSPLQSRCVQLARMGCVVFHYDMVGYADSLQLAHRAGVRGEMNTPENWGFFSPQAEARLQSIFGLQTYNSIRALDFLLSLPEVDPARIGVTGSSGGGTQTFILCAVDPRPAVAFPAVMVSTAMQGGCTCENANYLRVGTGNIEIAGLFAPKPLGMTGADDWTKEIMTKGLPELQQLYQLLSAPDRVMARALLHFGHNYNYPSRAIMYSWFNKHLNLGLEEPVVEEDYQPLSIPEMRVWDEAHPRPPAGDDYERSLVRYLTETSDRQLAALAPHDSASLAEFRRVVGGAYDVLLGATPPPAGSVTQELAAELDRGDYQEFRALVRHAERKQELPVIFLHPRQFRGRVVVWVHERGKAGLFDSAGEPTAAVRRLLAQGITVTGIDLLGQGEFLSPGAQPLTETQLVGPPVKELEGYAGYTFGYNWSLFASRVRDISTVVSFIHHYQPDDAPRIDLLGLGAAGPWVAAAAAQCGDRVTAVAVDTAGFRFARLDRLRDPNFLPGGAKYADLPGLLALIAPHPLWLAGEGKAVPELVRAAYASAGATEALSLHESAVPIETSALETAALDWLCR